MRSNQASIAISPEDAALRRKLRNTWRGMIARTENPASVSWANYGGRPVNPVRMCKRWRNSFDHFAADVGLPPSLKHSIDRINSQQGYRPSNVRWATAKMQSNNRAIVTKVRLLEGVVGLPDAAKLMGLPYSKVYQRIALGGMPVSQSLLAAHYVHPKMRKQYGDARLNTRTAKSLAAEHGVGYDTVLARLKRGVPLADALLSVADFKRAA